MFRQPLRNFLLAYLLNFILKVFVIASKYFRVDIKPPEDVEPTGYKKLSPLTDPLPIIEKEKRKKDYRKILAEAEAGGNPIKPVRRIKPLDVDVDACPVCDAPAAYLYSFGKDPNGYQKLQCKVCSHQWTPDKPKSKKNRPTYRCPYCNYALIQDKSRKSFTIFKCRNDNCPKWIKQGERYRFRAYDFEPDKLECSKPAKPSVNLANSHFGPFVISCAANLYISLGLSLREAARAFKMFWQINISYETIQSWMISLAANLAPLIKRIPLPLSGIVVIDETYIKIKGNWHYMFTACDGLKGFIISQHISSHRDVRAALTILKSVVDRYNNREFIFVTDKAPIYDVAAQAASVFFNAKIRHRPVKGLTPPPQGDNHTYRPYKNRMERLFGSYKAHYKRHKSFSSFEGAVAHAVLYQLYYNHLKPHAAFNNKPPIPLKNHLNKPVDDWAKLLRWITDNVG